MNNQDEVLILVFEDAIDYIVERCDADRDTIEKVVLLEEDYTEEHVGEPTWDFDAAMDYIVEKSDIDWETVEKVMLMYEDYMRSIGIVKELPESMVEEINEIIREKNEKKEYVQLSGIENGKYDEPVCMPKLIRDSMSMKVSIPQILIAK